jgi:hypothetical protein
MQKTDCGRPGDKRTAMEGVRWQEYGAGGSSCAVSRKAGKEDRTEDSVLFVLCLFGVVEVEEGSEQVETA